ncbi:hypothetical protein [Embleya scabrispora]|uniref:hypothetical protein n=1 Tax=Embleya scabrispora TaxID=159449 RepID=UPI00035E35CA|nr:hypothetical protein [Embleya scabrispora]MYS83027.1 hypothetical protein [Streptomyces sp. SID5474]
MTNPIGPLTAADEGFHHQVAETFATVATTDPSWTEKVCAMAAARDGSLQLGFGLGKYTNRNVMDGYAGLSRGVEQLTVRASRRLSPEPHTTTVGPIRYEVVEPLKVVRFVLEANEAQPIAFDWTFEAVVPAVCEDRTHNRRAYRTTADLVRYHQTGVASGWVEVDGERTEITPDTWVSTRDHSWGTRYDVGAPAADLEPAGMPASMSFRMIWAPILMERGDGSRYALFLHYQITGGPGFAQKRVMGGVEHPDGRVEEWADLVPDLSYDPVNRRLRGGKLHATMADGSARPLQLEVVSATGFHLGAGLYFGLDGRHHGEWRGDLHVEGERIADCSTPEQARRLHQIRDTVVRVTDPVGGGVGWGNCQPIVTGADPALGLTAESSFM